jgi:uncharacterized protein (TIGR03083 family)
MVRDAYEEAAGFFEDTVARIQEAEWAKPALGEWTVRDLVGHTNRALLTVETYLDNPADTVELRRPVDYFLRVKVSHADPAAVAARGREAGKALGTEPLATVRDTAARVLMRLREVDDDTLLTTPVGGMRLIDYLPSRVFELTVHTLDLAAATSQNVRVPDAAARVTFLLLAEMAYETDKIAPLLLAATGRSALPAGFTVL